ncbi:MAG: Na+/H+ antiporter NhaA [Actinomycetota bacterium]|nr:Na+/H+ antiporter NhaA [Actinomycetota bacterium]
MARPPSDPPEDPRPAVLDDSRARGTWIDSERLLARSLGRAVRQFIQLEAAGGIALLAATVAALVWANSPWSDGYHTLWSTPVIVEAGPLHFDESLRAVVNDALMTLFFFVVGLEIKRELVAGELRDPRSVGLPVLAALGGMVVPAAIYGALNAGGPGSAGWGVPMATDIAFALGIVALLGDRVPAPLKVFLLTLAIVDDIGAILVIAAFYSAGLSWPWLGAAAGGLAAVAGLRRLRVWYVPVYAVIGAAVWFATHESGIHATIAGVALGLLTPARPLQPQGAGQEVARVVGSRPTAAEAKAAGFVVKEEVPVTERLENALHPWTSFVVVPLFALANAGVTVSAGAVGDTLTSAVGGGIILGLVIGKLVGVAAASWIAVRLGLGRLPAGVSWLDVLAVAALAGIGFTVSLFIAGLAFDDPARRETATLAILIASAGAAFLGAAISTAVTRRTATS